MRPHALQQVSGYHSASSGVFAVLVTRGALPALGAGVMSPPAPSGTVTAIKLEYWHQDHLGRLLATADCPCPMIPNRSAAERPAR